MSSHISCSSLFMVFCKSQNDIRTRLAIDIIVLDGVGCIGFMSMLPGSDRVIAQLGRRGC